MNSKKDTKSPLKNPPVRLPGQSVDERIQDVLYDKVITFLVAAVLMLILAGLEWYRKVFHVQVSPWTFTFYAVPIVGYCAWRIWKGIKEIRHLQLGRSGERVVGQYLEETLMPLNYHVLHDILGDGFNIDHVIVGATGVYSVETKTRSKPAKGNASIEYDGEKVTVNGWAPDRDPILQAKASAHWLHELIESSTGKKFPVQPIVLFPGWYVEKMPAHADVWVLNEKAVASFVQNAKSVVSPEDVSLIVFHLKRYVIAKTA